MITDHSGLARKLSGSLWNKAHPQLLLIWIINKQCPAFVRYAEAKGQMLANVYNWEDQLKNEISFHISKTTKLS